jgi:hypothetical protein
MRWFRLYTEIIDDWKVAELSDKEFRHFVYLLCMAGEEEKEGKIPCSLEAIAWRFRDTLESVKPSIDKMIELGILSNNAKGVEFVNWEKRQFKSDNVAERVRNWRTKKKDECETLHETLAETLHGNVDRNVDNRTEQSRTEQKERTDIPRKKIVNLYHGILPELPTVKAWTDRRQKTLKARWNEDKKRQDLEWWKKYFKYVKESLFLMGQKEDFRADIDFLISPKLLNVIEGKYHR